MNYINYEYIFEKKITIVLLKNFQKVIHKNKLSPCSQVLIYQLGFT